MYGRRTLQVASSNANLPKAQAMAWGGAQYLRFMEQTGYDGFEVIPLRSRLTAEIAAEVGVQTLQRVIVSTHQPFRRKTVQEMVSVPRSIDEAKKLAGSLSVAAAMPRVDRSLGPMLHVQDAAGRPINAVVYPNEQMLTGDGDLTHPVDYREWQGRFRHVLWQPTAEALAAWNVLSRSAAVAMRGMKERMRDEGLDKACFDSHHWSSVREGYRMPPWRNALPGLLQDGDCVEFHAAPARPDMGGDTEQLERILDGDIAQTELGDMLMCVRENRSRREPFLIVVEMPHDAVLQADSGSRTFAEVHEDIVNAIWDVAA